ncbi:DHA2 family lincomycin resistance protein-like MFS transporter [Leucobacter exalbidus]|uniref:DHA2 family lincomycin resistance protein-like MFS transporter n=1 Tax=Leucobacter exalbidus TaxID=662960 RepID=A0A940T3Q5_9MICO|nr:MDR family MFS transporter [Leucobacter exalbidus]MBP1326058.1 DHA2 family lincomycin resistance protein-like MFS transporter [Leucobacter exalbidus]
MSMHSADSNTNTNTVEIGQGRIPRSVKMILAVLVITAFVMMLNETTVAVAMPAIMADYAITATTAQWLLTGFLLTMAVVLPTTGWMLERFTTRSVFLFATVTFLLGTVAAAVAPMFAVILAARVLQAIGTAMIMPLLMTVSMTLVPAQRRGAVMGLIAVVMAAGPALGPTVAGAVLSFTSWHGIFWVMVPLVAAATLIGAFKLTNVGERRASPFDLLSVILSVFAFGGLVYGLSSFSVIIGGGQAATIVIAVLIVGVVGLGLFVWRQLARGKRHQALLDLRPLAARNFTLSLIVLMGLMAALLGVVSTLPLYLQGSLLVTALVSGLVLLPGGALEAVLAPIAGRLFDRVGPRPLIIPGMAIVAATLFALAFVDEHTSVGLIIAFYAVFCIGLALLFTPIMTTALGSLPAHQYGHGSAILNTLQQLAGAAGTALLITIYSGTSGRAMAQRVAEPTALADGASTAFMAAAIVAAATFVVSLFITRAPRQPGEQPTVETAK